MTRIPRRVRPLVRLPMRVAALLALLALIPAAALVPAAALAGSLFVESGAEASLVPTTDEAVLRQRAVTVDFGALLVTQDAADAPRLDLFPDAEFVAILDRSEKNRSGSVSWKGSLAGQERSSVTLVSRDGVLVGNIRTSETLYQVSYSSGSLHVIREIDSSAFSDELPPEPVEFTPQELAEAAAVSAGVDDGSVIDVMVVYTAAARNAAGGTTAIENTIDLAISETNTGYANSNVDPRLRLVHTEESSYAGSGNLGLDRGRLRGKTDGYMDSVHATRDGVGADVVSLIQENGGGYCGVAYIMTSVSSAFESSAFNVTARSCATGYYSFAHELGHIQGARHDWFVDSTDNSPFAYNHGFVDPSDNWRTIMAYGNDCGDCTRIDHWSNPNVTDPVFGDPMGVSEGDFHAAENWKTLNNTAYTVANFRESLNCSTARLALDSIGYPCESTVEITVSDCDLDLDPLTPQSLSVVIASNSELGGESVVLTEDGVDSASFVGTLALSVSDASGVLLVAHGDTATVTYVDADDGEGGVGVSVLANAAVDCVAPTISNVQAVDVTSYGARVAFDTDESTTGTVHYGLSCAALTESLGEEGYGSAHSIAVAGLGPSKTHFYSVSAEDPGGNSSSEDKGGACYSFATPEAPDDFFTERFSADDNDLDHVSLVFTPDGSVEFYAMCALPITSLPVDPTGGTTLVLGDDESVLVNLGADTVSIFGTSHSSFYVGSNGYLTFGASDTAVTESPSSHFALPRVSGIFDDLNPAVGGSVSWKKFADRAVVTFSAVPEYDIGGSNTFQIELIFDGTIVISFVAVDALDGLTGLSSGAGLPVDFVESDLSAAESCQGIPCDSDGDGVCDFQDNCVDVSNANQCDTNLDGFGNACDPDSDGDLVVGVADFNDLRTYFGQSCASWGTCADVDCSCDGTVGLPDFNVLRSHFGAAPGPSGLSCAGSSPCPASACSHGECTFGAPLHPACSSCARTVCAADSACCVTAWSPACASLAASLCGGVCGDAAAVGDELRP
ncbi:MAG: hypothetical protein JRH19_00465 [Deltaproteobacteria bacterium]|nr:hypothetical protein [Deltaproteobacteria bacterium]